MFVHVSVNCSQHAFCLLRVLDLRANGLSGSIPESFGKMVSLHGVELDYNQLSGSIPDSIGNLVNMVYVLHLHAFACVCCGGNVRGCAVCE